MRALNELTELVDGRRVIVPAPCAKTALRHFGGLMAIRILFNSMQKVTEYCGEKG
jgi:hypothetical protein